MGVGDFVGAGLWAVALYYTSPVQLLLFFMGRIEAERPSDGVLRVAGRLLGGDVAAPDYVAPPAVYAATYAAFAAAGVGAAAGLNLALGDGTWSVASGIGLCLSAGVYELGRPKRYTVDEARELDTQWVAFRDFADARLERSGQCHFTDVLGAFRRAYRPADEISAKTVQSLVANWAPDARRTSNGYYRGLSVRRTGPTVEQLNAPPAAVPAKAAARGPGDSPLEGVPLEDLTL